MGKQQRYNGLITVDPDDEDERNRSVVSTLVRKLASPVSTLVSIILFIVLVTILGQRKFDLGNSGNGSSSSSLKSDENFEKLLFFNADQKTRGGSVLSSLNEKNYPKGGPCIVTLVTNSTKDVDELQTALKSLVFLRGDADPNHPAPVLIFNEGNLNSYQVQRIVESTNRPVAFPLVNFLSFPVGFNPESQRTEFLVKGRSPWGYYQMIRFWITGLWKHPAIEHFDTVMRIDSDSCFKEVNDYLPNLFNDHICYHSQYVGVEDGVEFLTGLYDFALNYMAQSRDPPEPRNYLLWDFIKNTWESRQSLPLFRTNFEVSRKSYMQSGDITRWHDAITEYEPFGVFRHRWGDAVTRFLTAAMFVNMDRIMTIRPTGYFHKIGCSKEEVDQAIATLKAENR